MATDLEAHRILTNIEVPDGGYLRERIWSVRDRLTLLPVGEPDTADLVGEINERCDRAGVPEGKPGERVEWLAAERERFRTELDSVRKYLEGIRQEFESLEKYHGDCHTLLNKGGVDSGSLRCRIKSLVDERDALRADLEAERAQLAGAPRNILDADKIRHAVNVIVAHVNQNSSSAEWIAAAILQENFA